MMKQADMAAMQRDSSLTRHGFLSDPDKRMERNVLGSLPLDVPNYTPQNMPDFSGQVMNMMPMAGITAFHGSPHLFNKFDMSKIGTGEGAQAYGHGLYFAENPGVAKSYADALGAKVNMGIPQSRLISQPPNKVEMKAVDEANNRMKSSFDSITVDDYVGKGNPEYQPKPFRTYYDYYNARNDLRYRDDLYYSQNKAKVDKRIQSFENKYKKDKNFKKEFHEFMGADAKPNWEHLKTPYSSSYNSASSAMGEIGQSHLYKVDIPDEQVSKMLDWDKPLSEQSKTIQKAFRDINTELEDKIWPQKLSRGAVDSGESMHWNIDQNMKKIERYIQEGPQGIEGVSELMKRHGIPGIKYLDQGSRQGGKGTSNFVLFDDTIPTIQSINDKPVGLLQGTPK